MSYGNYINCPFCGIGMNLDTSSTTIIYYCSNCDAQCPICKKIFKLKIQEEAQKYKSHLEEESLKQMLELNDRLKKHMKYHETHHTEYPPV